MIKKILLVLAMIASLGCTSYGETRRSPRDLMLIGRDYNLWEDVSAHPLSVGVNSWYNKELGSMPAVYGSIALLSYKDVVRLECGGTATWNHHTGWAEIDMLTGFSTLLNERIVVGIWLAPFWKLYTPWNDNPWGVMVGYAW